MRKHRAGSGLSATLALAVMVMAAAAVILSGRALPVPISFEAAVVDRVNAQLGEGRLSVADMSFAVGDGLVPQAHLGGVQLRTEDGGSLAALNQVTVDVSLGALLQGRLAAKRVSLEGAEITIFRSRNGDFLFRAPANGGSDADQKVDIGGLLATLDDAIGQGPMASLGEIDATDVVISLEDARSGRFWRATNARMRLRERSDGLAVSVTTDVFNGTDDVAEVQVSLAYDENTRQTDVGVRMIDMPAADIALQSPALGWLAVLDAPISGAVRFAVDGQGALRSLSGALDLEEGVLQPEDTVDPLPFLAARAYFEFDPERDRLDFVEVGATTPDFRVTASGHTYIGSNDAGARQNFVGQFTISEAAFRSDEIFAAPLSIDRAHATLRMSLDPFSVELAELAVEEEDVIARATGRLGISESHWQISLDATTEAIDAARILAFWPKQLAAKTRNWLSENVLAGDLSDVAFGVRHTAGGKPDLDLSFNYQNAKLRYMEHMPIVEDGRGRATLHDNAFSIAVDDGWIAAPGGGVVDGSGTVFSVENVHGKPAQAVLRLAAKGPLTPILEVIDLPPLKLMSRSGRSHDLAVADAEVEARVSLPLRKGLSGEDVDFDVRATAVNVTSDVLVPGRELVAPALTFLATPQRMSVEATGELDGLPLDAAWSMPLKSSTDRMSTTTGIVALTRSALTRFGVDIPPGILAGQGTAAYDLASRASGANHLKLTSNLTGVALEIPGLGWRKPPASSGSFHLDVVLGDRPEVERLVLRAPGLDLTGDVGFTSSGVLSSLDFSRLRVGEWLDAEGRIRFGAQGSPASIDITGGRIDLRSVPARQSGGSAPPNLGPLRVSLDRVTVSDTLALTGFSGNLRARAGGLEGNFTARLGGSVPLSGRLSPEGGATGVVVRSENAGAVLREAGLTPNARNGALRLELTPVNGAPRGHYTGTFHITDMRFTDAPLLASLVDAVSVVGLLDQMAGAGIAFEQIDGTFRVSPGGITLTGLSAVGPSLGISAEGVYNPTTKKLDVQGVVSPIYYINAIGGLISRPGEGLFGLSYRVTGDTSAPRLSVNPLSLLTPGKMRDLFRSRPPVQ